MPFTIQHQDTVRVIECAGDCGVNAAAELKALLSDALSSTEDLRVDLALAGEIDIVVLQLLWAAEREAAQTRRTFVCQPTDRGRTAARDAGMVRFPGDAGHELTRITDGEDDSHRG